MVELTGSSFLAFAVLAERRGLRSLAYKIAKNRKAHYVMLNIDAPAGVVAELERQLLAPDEEASDARLTEMIFTPGFSTAEQVTELAGRGVGQAVALQHGRRGVAGPQ